MNLFAQLRRKRSTDKQSKPAFSLYIPMTIITVQHLVSSHHISAGSRTQTTAEKVYFSAAAADDVKAPKGSTPQFNYINSKFVSCY